MWLSSYSSKAIPHVVQKLRKNNTGLGRKKHHKWHVQHTDRKQQKCNRYRCSTSLHITHIASPQATHPANPARSPHVHTPVRTTACRAPPCRCSLLCALQREPWWGGARDVGGGLTLGINDWSPPVPPPPSLAAPRRSPPITTAIASQVASLLPCKTIFLLEMEGTEGSILFYHSCSFFSRLVVSSRPMLAFGAVRVARSIAGATSRLLDFTFQVSVS